MISTTSHLVSIIDDLRSRQTRVIVGIVGEPGSGKSTVTNTLVQQLDCESAVVPMDGFHLASAELIRLGRAERKGAPDTFDVAGYVNLLNRLRHPQGPVTYAPDYVRAIEEPIAGSIPVPADVPVIITEGNYLLHAGDGWGAVKPHLDVVAYLDCDPEQRIERLIRRHQLFGKAPDQAVIWATGSDERNAELVRNTRDAADLVIVDDHPHVGS
jgi:pantothenate kinase